MKKVKTKFQNLFLIKGITHYDKRGYFRELIKQKFIPKINFYNPFKIQKKCY